jgi:hypothetical protein
LGHHLRAGCCDWEKRFLTDLDECRDCGILDGRASSGRLSSAVTLEGLSSQRGALNGAVRAGAREKAGSEVMYEKTGRVDNAEGCSCLQMNPWAPEHDPFCHHASAVGKGRGTDLCGVQVDVAL